MRDTVLNGGISNCKYIWHSSGGCEACNALDGTEYEYEDDIPDHPHPNCQCWIEFIDDNENGEVEDDEPCGDNCVITGLTANVENDFDIKEFAFVFDYGYETIEIIEAGIETFNIFQEKKTEMENTANSYDKYYHAKANCESAELGAIEALWAVVWSVGKELLDIYKKTKAQKMKFKDILKDSIEDLRADLYGLQKAKEHGYCSDKVKDVGKIFKK